ncbi:MAG: sulfatase-like hydrolase/transferase [Polyangiaceae bacterium]|nr:sulfatase-like hydrolase/transferase [Polyangiaceae bacterium]
MSGEGAAEERLQPGADGRPGAPGLHPGARAAIATVLGFGLIALTNAIAIAASIAWPFGGLGIRALHHAFDAAGVLGLGVLAGAAVGAGAAIVERPGSRARRAAGLLVWAVIAGLIMDDIVGRELRRQALVAWNGRFERPVLAAYLALSALSVPAAHALGAWLGAARWRWVRPIPIVVATGALAANQLIVRDDYHGTHGAVAWGAATLAAAGAARWVDPLARRLSKRAAIAASAAVLVAGALGLSVPPPDAVRVELFRLPSAISAWVLARTVWTLPGPRPAQPAPGELAEGAPDSPWWRDRRGLPPVPPTSPPLAPGGAPVVVLLTIDATRADAIDDPANERLFPAFTALKRQGAWFARATSAGSQTAVSLSTLFTGLYFSQLVWAHHGYGLKRFPYPATDPAPRFPQLLADRGVTTASFCGVNFLAGEYGVARGFVEETVIPKGRAHAQAADVMRPLLARLRRAGSAPLFAYAHIMEPHSPYDRGALKKGPAWERYLSEIQVADAHVGALAELIARRFPDRGYLIVTSDHGEAFGEHGTREHTKTIYEELLRVPLFVKGPGALPRRIEERVGVIDLGPTILDLFGVETPSTFMGQTLVPLLAGRDAPRDRPLLAEGRLRRALYFGGLKVIDDPRRKIVEAYDLERDPGELQNLYDVERARVDPALAALRAFFATHRASKPGYVPMYKP